MIGTAYPRPGDVKVDATAVAPAPSRTLIRWGAIFAGLLLGMALLVLLTSLWFSLAYGSHIGTVARNLRWFVGISAIGSLFVAGILTGYLSGVRGIGTGILHGFTLWALLLLLTVSIGIPSIVNVFNIGQVTSRVTNATGGMTSGAVTALWASFWTILGGFAAAGLGGALGGASSRDPFSPSNDAGVRRDEIVTRDPEAARAS